MSLQQRMDVFHHKDLMLLIIIFCSLISLYFLSGLLILLFIRIIGCFALFYRIIIDLFTSITLFIDDIELIILYIKQ